MEHGDCQATATILDRDKGAVPIVFHGVLPFKRAVAEIARDALDNDHRYAVLLHRPAGDLVLDGSVAELIAAWRQLEAWERVPTTTGPE